MRAGHLITVGLLALTTQAALACEPSYPVRDAWIKVQPNCAFTEGEDFHAAYGGEAVDVGQGKVAQKIVGMYDGGLCGIETEKLLVIDCNGPRDVMFDGQAPDEFYHVVEGKRELWGEPDLVIAQIQPPHGPIALRANTSLDELIAMARKSDVSFTENRVARLVASLKARNRFDPYCVCKLFYPDSAGASQ